MNPKQWHAAQCHSRALVCLTIDAYVRYLIENDVQFHMLRDHKGTGFPVREFLFETQGVELDSRGFPMQYKQVDGTIAYGAWRKTGQQSDKLTSDWSYPWYFWAAKGQEPPKDSGRELVARPLRTNRDRPSAALLNPVQTN